MTRLRFGSLLLAATAAATATLPVAAQPPSSLLFSPRGQEESRSGSGGTVLRNLYPRSIANLTPNSACNHSAEKFAPALGYQTLVGDEDADGDVHTANLMGAIDAVLVKPYERDPNSGQLVPRFSPVDVLDCYVSPKRDIGNFVSGAPGLRRGDCGTIVRAGAANGQVRHFITAEQIIAAFGIIDTITRNRLDPKDLDLDAIAVDRNGNIFLSLEEDRILIVHVGAALATIAVADGAILWLPPAAWTPDARGNVMTVVAQRGRIAQTEAMVDARVAGAMVADVAGLCPVAIIDTDAVALDHNGGSFTAMWNGIAHALPNLLFAGESLTGAGVLSTAAGGTIATVNGCALARACGAGPTTGRQMGLLVSGNVDSLDGLTSLRKEPCRFVLGSATPLGLGGPIQVDVGTNQPFGGVLLMVGIGALPVSPSIDFRALFPGTACFPELYPAVLGASVWVPLAPDGYGDWVGSLGPIVAPAIPSGLLFQAAGFAGTVQLSTPVTLH